MRYVTNVKGEKIVISRSGEVMVTDDNGRERERHKVPYGATLAVADGKQVKAGGTSGLQRRRGISSLAAPYAGWWLQPRAVVTASSRSCCRRQLASPARNSRHPGLLWMVSPLLLPFASSRRRSFMVL